MRPHLFRLGQTNAGNYGRAWLVLGVFAMAMAAREGMAATDRSQLLSKLTNHVIRADRDGLALRTDQAKEVLYGSTNAFRAYVENILDRAEAWSLEKHSNTVRLLVHVHGGLTSWKDTVDRMSLVDQIKGDSNQKVVAPEEAANPRNHYYPIFVSWPSDYFGSYWEHAHRLQQGNRVNVQWSIVRAPTVVLTDIAKSAVNLPIAWWLMAVNSKDQVAWRMMHVKGEARLTQRLGWRWISRNYKMATTNAHRSAITNEYRLATGEATQTLMEGLLRTAAVGGMAPVRATLGGLAQGATTINAWKVMKRRTSNLLYSPDRFEMGDNGIPRFHNLKTNSPAGDFFRILLERVEKNPDHQYRITFVGHSMGTIVLNRVFNAYRNELIRTRCVENIIYMAAACSVWDGAQAIIPLLEAGQTDNGNRLHPKFYNLTLHPLAEISERMGGGKFLWAAPSGSLLDVIDSHLESPSTPLERTLGSQVNVLSAIETFADVREHCVFKGFDFIPGRLPSRHGDFNRCPFWWEEFRSIDRKPRTIGPVKSRRLRITKESEMRSSEERLTSTYANTPGWVEKGAF